MLPEITLITAHWKMGISVVALGATVLAEAALPLNEYERIGVMGIGVVIIGYLARAVADERSESKREREAARTEREAFHAALERNTAMTKALVEQHDKAINTLITKEINRP